MKKILKLALVLGLVAGLAAAGLSLTNSLTAPVINAREVAKDREGLETVMPGAEYSKMEVQGDTEGSIDAIYDCGNGTYVYKMKVNGYGGVGSITFMIALDPEGKVVGYTVTQHGETKGYGSQVAEQKFIDSVIGLTNPEELDTISGATISSTAVKNGLIYGMKHYRLQAGLDYE
ncbi:MAG: FMN-binding protein [Erysipelotrichales bacterium]|nr:FMN-binding protein [Erysipelotrichales bacterium]